MDLLALMKPELQGHDLVKLVTHGQDRPSNDHRYVIDATKIRGLGWKEKVSWQEGLRKTVKWFIRHRHRFTNIDQALEAHPVGCTKTNKLSLR
uniref:NAD(P)-binding domain-containing protein n=1 Tax=Hyaloperonospora arabidopsidis (strain Emoy2) TaxID=559515 RepID=M4B7K6_HYAAE